MLMNFTCLMPLACRMIALVVFLVSTVSVAAMASPSTYLVPEGESRVYRLERPVSRVAVGNPAVADFIMINPSEIYLVGKKPGTTNLILWYQNGNFVSASLNVNRNTNPIKVLLTAALPNERDIEIYSLGPTVVISGSVSNALAAEIAWRIVSASFGGKASENNPEYTLINSWPVYPALPSVTGMTKIESLSGSGSGSNSGSAGSAGIPGVVNLLKVRDPQQVRLEIRIAEVSRSYIETLGLGWTQGSGNIQGSLMSGFVSNSTLNLLFKNGNQLKVEAESKKGFIKLLAEPTMVTMSGQEGYFLVGGKIYTPTIGSNGSVDYVERFYGVGFRFFPTVLDSGRISLRVTPEVSAPLKEAVTAGTTTSLPSFKLNIACTTVQMKEGENLVIGGLLQNNLEETIRGVPLLSQIPILGALFRRTDKASEKTELLIVVRPTLVKAGTTVPELPTDRVVPPTDKELFIDGKLQGSQVK